MSNRRNLRQKQRMERVQEVAPLPWLQAVDWDDAGDPVLDISENEAFLPVELVA